MTRLEPKDLDEIIKRNPALGIRTQRLEKSEKMQKVSKYRNQKAEVEDIKFDSKKEAARFQELLFLYRYGEITRLKLQETFVLQNSYKTEKGERILAITYTPDFTYCKGNQLIAEDVKASAKFQDPVYKMKKKMFIERYPQYEFIETY